MKKRLRYIISGGVIASFLLVSPLAALAESNTSSNAPDDGSDSASSSSTMTKTDDSMDSVKTDAGSIKDRLEKIKTSLKIKLTTVEQARLKTRCKASQAVIATLNDRFGNSVVNRTKAYDELISRLNNIVVKLQAANIATTELEAEIAALQTKVATYKTDLVSYRQALSDLKLVDCATDPTAFKAALEAARAAHMTLVGDTTAIKTYVVSTIKPTLQTIRQQLETQKSTSTSEGQ